MNGAQGQNRTADTRIFNPLLYRLSYLGTPGIGFLGEAFGPVQRQCPGPRQSSSGSFSEGFEELGPSAGAPGMA
jgi:hypothetical protein